MTSRPEFTDEAAENLAEKIALVLKRSEAEDRTGAILEDLVKRVEMLEASASAHPPARPLTHPSLEKYSINEAVAGSSEEGKLCTFEPHGRPCDHCSMCSSRGF